MTKRFGTAWLRVPGRQAKPESPQKPLARRIHNDALPLDIAPDDPLVAYFLSAPGAIELMRLQLDSPALRTLKAAGIAIAIPLVSQGELVGLLNLGPRLSQQDYSTDDRRLLENLATQAAPAVRVAQLVREQQAQARARERVEQELRVARLIQQTLLPRELPELPGWQLSTYYQPARAVGGDFYDFLAFEDGRLGIVIGDVTDKGVPAALVMATTRSILRSAAHDERSPGAVLERTNDLLHPDIPPKMFVTCLYGILDPASGHLVYANAGHDLPYQRYEGGARELRATGMPLGLMPGMRYEERETYLASGDTVLLYSDGLVEAHNPEREMFGFPRLATLMGDWGDTVPLIERLLNELASFTGAGWEQEDDVTLVALHRERACPVTSTRERATNEAGAGSDDTGGDGWRRLDEFEVLSAPGNERQAMRQVETAVAESGLTPTQVEHLKTAVAEATMNAMEHGNHYQADLPVWIEVRDGPDAVVVRIRDFGGGKPILEGPAPDLEAKLAEEQTPRGWGLFLIKHLVDEMHVTSDDVHHTVELIVRREEATNAGQNA